MTYATPFKYRKQVATRRERLRSEGRCINGPTTGSVGRFGIEHGPVVRAGKCQHCLDVYAKTRPVRVPENRLKPRRAA